MSLIFFINSSTVDITNYTIKDIPGSSGRLDVISRCILAVLLSGDNSFEKKVQIWVFLDKYGTFIFNSELLNYEIFPKNELKLTDYFVNLIRKNNSIKTLKNNPLNLVKTSEIGIIEALKEFIELNYKVFVLNENGENFFKYFNKDIPKQDMIFVVGNQIGDFINSKDLLAMNLPNLSLGTQSYLSSSIIRLIKLSLLKLV